MLLRTAQQLAPAALEIHEVGWQQVPPFNADLLAQGMPEQVARIAAEIAGADGVLIVSPEYNFSMPGMFKNLLDWISRCDPQPLANKPVAIASAATGMLGGARMQYELRKTLLFVNADVLVKPEVFVGMAAQKFDAEGRCTDEGTMNAVQTQLLAFEQLIRKRGAP
jgi:chromate reductase